MMKRLVVFAALVAMFTQIGHAQPAPVRYVFGPAVYAAIDYPTHGQAVSSAQLVFAGWAFECQTGDPAHILALYRWDGIALTFVPTWRYVTIRPDAQAWFSAHGCPNLLLDDIGWHLVPQQPEPSGYYLYYVVAVAPSGAIVLFDEVNVGF